ncbi:MAG: hypothetical protein AB1324_07435, partial [Candidatus Micrarchaeota archaeon]
QEQQRQQQAVGIDLSRLVAAKAEVRGAVSEQSARAFQVASAARALFMQEAERQSDMGVRRSARESELMRLASNPDAFQNCQVQYAYNQRQKIYSIRTELDGRPRIVTVRVGENFMEMSLADRQGNPLETWRQEDGRGISVSRAG